MKLTRVTYQENKSDKTGMLKAGAMGAMAGAAAKYAMPMSACEKATYGIKSAAVKNRPLWYFATMGAMIMMAAKLTYDAFKPENKKEDKMKEEDVSLSEFILDSLSASGKNDETDSLFFTGKKKLDTIV